MVAVQIKPRDSSFAKQCPQRIQLDVLQPCEPLPDPPFLQMLYRAGNEHEDDTFALLFDGLDGAVVIDADDVDAREWQTMQAVQSRALVIAGGRLPVDHEAHRVGQPDLLVRHGEGYLPIEVKSHKALDRVRKQGTGTALVSDVTTPFLGAAAVDAEHTPRKHVGDLLQLAHYRALLDAAGIGSPECFAAGVCGTEGVIVWHDLAEATLPAPEYVQGAGSPAGPMSPLARYELEFAHRLGILAAAEDHLDDGTAGLLAEPVVCDQCDMCRWREWCGDRLEEVADLSLIAGVGAGRRGLYKAHGVGSLHDLAAAGLADGRAGPRQGRRRGSACQGGGAPGVDALGARSLRTGPSRSRCCRVSACTRWPTWRRSMRGRWPSARPVPRTRPGRSNWPGPVWARRRHTARAASTSSPCPGPTSRSTWTWRTPTTAAISGAHSSPTAARLRPSPGTSGSPRGTPTSRRASWWRSRSSGRGSPQSGPGRRPKAPLSGPTATAGAPNRDRCDGWPTGSALADADQVDEFFASDEWVDLLEVVRDQLITGRSMGLKETAPLAGFAWRSDDGGGTLAIVKYEQATDEQSSPAARGAAQEWLVEYNEDDVRATAALRDWLDGAARDLPSIEAAPG